MDANPDTDTILHHFYTTMTTAFKDGRIDRSAGHDFVPASVDPATGVQSKDVTISPETGVSARLYLPGNATPGEKLPLVLYFHGGGFACYSAFAPAYHKHLNVLVAEAKVVAISVNYRLAPEHPLPAAYDDSWAALKWATSESTSQDWIENHADLNRVFLGGDSAGGNIAHHMAMRVGLEKPKGVNLIGIFFNCAFFYGNEQAHKFLPTGLAEASWRFVCPGTIGYKEDPWINPGMDPNLSDLGCKRVLVYTAEKDVVKGGSYCYKEAVMKSGWGGEIEVVEAEGEDHVFSVASPESQNGIAMLKKVASFINY